MGQRANEARNGGFQVQNSAKVRVLPAICDLPVPKVPDGVELSAAERKQFRSIFKGPYGHYMDDAHAHEVCVYIKLTSAVLSGVASAWHASERTRLAHQLGLTPAGLKALGMRIETEDDA